MSFFGCQGAPSYGLAVAVIANCGTDATICLAAYPQQLHESPALKALSIEAEDVGNYRAARRVILKIWRRGKVMRGSGKGDPN